MSRWPRAAVTVGCFVLGWLLVSLLVLEFDPVLFIVVCGVVILGSILIAVADR